MPMAYVILPPLCLVYMADSTPQRRRQRPSIEVVDAKVAVDLATAQTYSENVFLFVPNLIGAQVCDEPNSD